MLNQTFILCAFYTANTKYEEVYFEHLHKSLSQLDIDNCVEVIPSQGNWIKNTSYKAAFAQKMLLKFPNKNIVLLDVDAEISKYPELFDNIPDGFHFAAHFLDHQTWYRNGSNKKEFLSGSLFIRNTGVSHFIVQKWIDRCVSSMQWEQQILHNVIEDNKIEVYNIDISYCYINSLPDGSSPHVKVDNPVITHFQASRQLRHNV